MADFAVGLRRSRERPRPPLARAETGRARCGRSTRKVTKMSLRSIAQFCSFSTVMSLVVAPHAHADEALLAGAKSTTTPRSEPFERSTRIGTDTTKRPPFRENGRFGVLGALTNDMWKAGIVFEHEHFEANVLFHAGFRSDDTRDLHLIFKAGGRIPLGTLNYLAIGGEYGPHWLSLIHI